jgi:hypothetical protein
LATEFEQQGICAATTEPKIKVNIMTILNKINAETVTGAYRKSWLAWLGANQTAFNMAQNRVEKLSAGGQALVNSLIEKGQTVEDQAQTQVASAKDYIKPRVLGAREAVTAASGNLFKDSSAATNTQLEALWEEVAKLSATVTELSEKVPAPRTRAKKAASKEESVKEEATNA